MSPASQGGLEVERYIGTCLFSTHTRGGVPSLGGAAKTGQAPPHGKSRAKGSYTYTRYGRQQNTQPPWAGLPLISMPARRPRCGAEDGLAQLAIHTQGAPLILAGSRYPRGGSGPHCSLPRHRGPAHRPTSAASSGSSSLPKKLGNTKENKATGGSGSGGTSGSDSLSVASDESSGGNSSENSLPRIIKPRKRRKKDRKPPQNAISQSPPSPPPPPPPPPPPSPPPQPPPPPSSSVEVLLNSTVPTEPCVEEAVETNISGISTTCSGLESAEGSTSKSGDYCSSEELPHFQQDDQENIPSLTQPTEKEPEGESGELCSCQCRYCDPAGRVWAALPVGASPLRRSWSEPPAAPSSGDGLLQVSTHIVTSLNGHRDLEIRFFSSSPPQRQAPARPVVSETLGSPWKTSAPLLDVKGKGESDIEHISGNVCEDLLCEE